MNIIVGHHLLNRPFHGTQEEIRPRMKTRRNKEKDKDDARHGVYMWCVMAARVERYIKIDPKQVQGTQARAHVRKAS